ncbi:MAG: trimethylamine methyltransferase family protein [Ignisphaera sp.]|nr:trimethylamine methyltransferase family protein [Ignisphaera sp.]MDW8085703.1 trimethylamine methyltransferase family protein [Ignisphaera sp.]
MARPRIEVLDRDEIQEIHESSLNILSRVGVKVDHEEALKLLNSIGVDVDFNKRVARIPEHVVREALSRTPNFVRLYHRDGKQYIDLHEWNTYFVVGSAAYYYMDFRTNEVRRPVSRDLAEVAKVTDYLPNTHMVSTALVPADVPEIIADRWRMYVVIKNCSKPIDTGAFTLEGVPDAAKLMAAVVGEENVGRKPFMIFAACSSPPLKWSALTLQNLMDCARYGIPVHIIPMPQTGGTAPATIAGAITQANAEFLAGLVIAQFTRPGAPIVYSGSPTVFDQRFATSCTGYIEVGLISAATSQLAKFYRIPSGCYTMVSDSKTVDAQSSLETAFGALISVLAGINMAIGSGMLLEENCISLIKLAIDDDAAGSALRFARGIHVDAETIAEKVMEEVGPGGLFLKHKHTRSWWRREHFIPKLLDKRTTDMWKRGGSKDLNTVAREYVEKILREHSPEPLPPDVEKILNESMQMIARKYGVEKLPEV